MSGAEVSIRGAKATVTVTGQVDIRPLAFATDKVDVSGSYMAIVNAPANPIINYNYIQGLGSGSSGFHNYVTTGNFKVSGIEVSASGATKIAVKAGDIGLEITMMTAFASPSNPTAQLRFYESLQLTVGQRLQIVITNRELQATDCYSTIFGFNT